MMQKLLISAIPHFSLKSAGTLSLGDDLLFSDLVLLSIITVNNCIYKSVASLDESMEKALDILLLVFELLCG